MKRCKKAFKMLTTLVLTIALVLTTVAPAVVQAAEKKALTLNSTEVTVLMGKTFDFNVTNAKKGSTYIWKSSNNKIATIDNNGVVLGVNKGEAKIECIITTPESKKYRLKAMVLVVKPAIKVEINNKITHITAGQSYNLNTTIIPASSTDTVKWTTSNKKIADPTSNGVFKASETGSVTLTATTLSGKSDSVTIQVLAKGEDYAEITPEPEKKDEPKEEGPTYILNEDFSKSAGLFTGRGGALVKVINEAGAEGTKGYLSVTNRTAAWNGASADITSLVTPGKSYEVSGWVKYTDGPDTEVFKITQQKNGNSWPAISGEVTVEKNKWTKLTGTMVVDADTGSCEVYFETATNASIDFLCDNLTIVDPTGETKAATPKEETKASVSGVVYSNGFEEKAVLDARGSSERTITKVVARSGKASLQVTRTAGWDGAGVRFNTANNLLKSDFYGKTVHVSMYVMYKEGGDTAEFKLNNKLEKADNSDNILAQKTVKKGEWTLIEADCKIADGATGDIIFVETENDAALTFFVDDVKIEVVK